MTIEQRNAIIAEARRRLKSGQYTVEYEMKLFKEGAKWALDNLQWNEPVMPIDESDIVKELQAQIKELEKKCDDEYQRGYDDAYNGD